MFAISIRSIAFVRIALPTQNYVTILANVISRALPPPLCSVFDRALETDDTVLLSPPRIMALMDRLSAGAEEELPLVATLLFSHAPVRRSYGRALVHDRSPSQLFRCCLLHAAAESSLELPALVAIDDSDALLTSLIDYFQMHFTAADPHKGFALDRLVEWSLALVECFALLFDGEFVSRLFFPIQ